MKDSWKQLLHRGLKGPEKTLYHAQFTKEEKTQLQSDPHRLDFYSGWRLQSLALIFIRFMLSFNCWTLALLNWNPLQIYLNLCCIESQLLCASLMRRGNRNLLFQNDKYKFVTSEAAWCSASGFFQRFCLLAINVHLLFTEISAWFYFTNVRATSGSAQTLWWAVNLLHRLKSVLVHHL